MSFKRDMDKKCSAPDVQIAPPQFPKDWGKMKDEIDTEEPQTYAGMQLNDNDSGLKDKTHLTKRMIQSLEKLGYTVTKNTPWYITGRGGVMNDPSGKVEARQAFLGAYSTKEEALHAVEEIRIKWGKK